ncbi:MAG: DUF3237 domain-containing protein [Acidimicrobiia bacterium]|nr:DUF3237 domain-containing protein [Acidimicrobiia bacterium]
MAHSTIDVEHLFTITADLGDNTHALIRNGPAGTRVIASVTGGSFEGPRLKGTVVPPGGDWVSVRPNRIIKLDVRLLLVTDDDESILMTYQGIGTPADDGPTQLRTAPTFETGADAYSWLNDVQAVGIGTSDGISVTYDIYALS